MTPRPVPEATVGRLPVYLRALVEIAEGGESTISSERLAEAAGVNSAKVRKDLSYLGSYGTRGVGYDVAYLIHQVRRELGLTQDWPVLIAGVGNLGHALANYRGFAERGFRVVALVDADPGRSGSGSASSPSSTSTTCPRSSGASDVAIGVICTPAAAAQEVADRMVAAGHPLDPELRPRRDLRPAGRLGPQGGPVDRAADPGLLRAAEGGPGCGRRTAGAARTDWPRSAAGRRRIRAVRQSERLMPLLALGVSHRRALARPARAAGGSPTRICPRPTAG